MIECIAATENKCENLDQLTKQLTQRRRDLNLDAVDFTLIDPTFSQQRQDRRSFSP